MMAGRPPATPNTGAPESPVQAPSPGFSPRVAGSNRRICKRSRAARLRPAWRRARVPPDLPSWRTATPVPATVKLSPGATVKPGPCRAAGSTRRQRSGELEQRHVGGRAMRQHGCQIEFRMRGDARDVAQLRLASLELDDLVVGARQHAMRGREHQVARERRAAAEISARADDQYDRAGDRIRRRGSAADDRRERGATRRPGRRGRVRDAQHDGRRLATRYSLVQRK